MIMKKSMALFSVVTCGVLASYGWLSSPDAPARALASAPLANPVPNTSTTVNSIHTAPVRGNGLAQRPLSTAENLSASAFDSVAAEAFLERLRNYSTGLLSTDEKHAVEQSAREWNTSQAGQAFLVDTFFASEDPALATSMHNLILDADLKDPTLIVSLITRDATEQNTQFKERIIDLIADLNALNEVPYVAEIDDYLNQLADHPEAALREAARSQQVWYSAHQSKEPPAINTHHLLDPSPNVRREMYDLIEARLADPNFIGHEDIALSLLSLKSADYLEISQQEEERLAYLLQKLDVNGLN